MLRKNWHSEAAELRGFQKTGGVFSDLMDWLDQASPEACILQMCQQHEPISSLQSLSQCMWNFLPLRMQVPSEPAAHPWKWPWAPTP